MTLYEKVYFVTMQERFAIFQQVMINEISESFLFSI